MNAAKLEALDAAVTLVADMTTDDVECLLAPAEAAPVRWITGFPVAVH